MKTTSRGVPYLYLLPHAVFYFTFVLLPLLFGFFISLNKWGLSGGQVEFVGFKYYLRLFDFDFIRTQFFWKSIWVTLQYVAYSVPPMVLLGLVLALLVNSAVLKEWEKKLFRTIFLLPTALAVTVIAVIWRWVLSYDAGLLNFFLGFAGIEKIPWLTEQPGAWVSIVLATLWWTVGWNMILLLVGLQNIPQQIYEAAQVDGANPWQAFIHITLPNLRYMLLFVTIIQVIGSFNLFAQPQLMTLGGPERSTLSVMLYIYTEAFHPLYPRLGGSVAMGFVTGVIMLGFLVIQYFMFREREE